MTYRVMELTNFAVDHLPKGQRRLEDILNKMSADGWTFVQIVPGKTRNEDAAIFVRSPTTWEGGR